MSIVKNLQSWIKHEWPKVEVKPVAFFPLATAYSCPACRMIQDGAPHGRCERCGSQHLISVDRLLVWSSSSLHKQMEQAREAKRKAEAEEALKINQARATPSLAHRPDQEPQTLTEFRSKK